MPNNSKKGFRSMDPRKAHEIQSKGGSASPQNFAKNRKLAREAGAKGGRASHSSNNHMKAKYAM